MDLSSLHPQRWLDAGSDSQRYCFAMITKKFSLDIRWRRKASKQVRARARAQIKRCHKIASEMRIPIRIRSLRSRSRFDCRRRCRKQVGSESAERSLISRRCGTRIYNIIMLLYLYICICHVMYTGTYEIGALFSSWMKAWQDAGENCLVEPLLSDDSEELVIVANDNRRSRD